MTENPSLRRVRITSPDEMTQIIPYLIGFTPEESLVIAVIDQGVVAVTARVDIGDVQPQGQAELLLDRMWARFPGADAYMVAYTADPPAGWALLERCADHLAAGVARQTMVVDGDTWHLADGTSGPADRFGPLAAEASFFGLQRLPSRSELVASFASPPDTDELTDKVEAALDKLPQPDEIPAIITRMGELVRRNLPTTSAEQVAPFRVEVEDAVQLAVLAQHPKAREVAMLSMTRADAKDHLAMWRTVVNNVPEYGAEAPLFLAGMAAWVAGEGAAASIALDRTLEVGEPGQYPPARLLGELIDQVVPPSAWVALRTDGLANANPLVRDAVISGHTPAVWESIPQHPIRQRPQPPDVAPPAPGIAI
ncbi:MAG: DUF4192 domain-containing protein [Propionicimonas sp.]|nr:DUF4192 domain-containing protein [Propionicimonas sp.]